MFNYDENSGLLFSKKFIIIGIITILITFIILVLTDGFADNFTNQNPKTEQTKVK